MLGLTRRLHEDLELRSPNGEIVAVIRILEIRGTRVRLGVEADKESIILDSKPKKTKIP